jgi:lipoic acid synthetase
MRVTTKKPPWLKVRAFSGAGFDRVNRLLREHHLNTVCQAANCPNRGECFNRGTATFLILGPVCTRQCKFCSIGNGSPGPVDVEEPERVAEMVHRLGLKHVVLTSVTRDDLPDGGAGHFAEVVACIRGRVRSITVEVLTPDFRGKPQAREIIVNCSPDVFNHNVETVPRLYPGVRPGADYQCSLNLLRHIARESQVVVKSGIMVGMGESLDELNDVFGDLADSGVSILTIGQYLPPSRGHFPVHRYLHPDEFIQLRNLAEQAGIRKVISAPLVRSSYRADQVIT